ncbi:TetR family transcriptional regulator [Saccharibacillus sp. O23]|uniref:TetR/AcrR family transcriptional regulator n=1 Tax=Saccharibacillus sp. O23 TaxID=2009338 RepID=UPI000B4E40FF|nr:TetR/AcrR family transcriptional regulator [Saccharibacillus sp. O23]OWR32727.1 TetR family transcriptional regulator [Saccharibacillus sp. O23]
MDRRVRKTRETLFDTLIQLLREKEFERITIQEIADRADVNRGTVYLHFEDKYDLLNRCIDSYLVRLNDSCLPIEPSESPEVSLLRTFRYLENSADVYSVLLRSEGVAAFRLRLSELLRQGVEEQFDRLVSDDRLNKEISIQFVTTAIVGLLEWWVARSMPYSAEEMVRQLMLLLGPYGLAQASPNAEADSAVAARPL